ncbi:GNAT family N-acetyltransferase [Microbacterium pseudoresistens]|uniref:Putative acetyltransferase n=1 Tax=Microbacterium pseudoresistens TaxID=640634 RepID=A0A7Y9EWB5_9MICO|nr:GNAT family N-acetyltransferase [Microbacterium pseudoresistens]NYD55006.1 putative acetyltransferase [Microbacterium pseudoresistens]
MTASDALAVPVDPTSRQRLAESALVYRVIDMSDDADAEGFLRADSRGFLDEDPTEKSIAEMRPGFSERRNVGVFDETAGTWPIATVNGWITPLTVPGGEIPMWAISSVTVAGTHRRRGIARNLLEGELRAASDAGLAIAGLTVSEATIYGRYGFASAVPVASVTVDTVRAGWADSARTDEGRVLFCDRETLADDLGRLHERTRTARAGQIAGWAGRWKRAAGVFESDKERASVRGVHYLDADGEVRGALAYTLSEVPDAFRSELKVRALIAETDGALRALWRFVVQHDLVVRARADLRPVDDPLPWLVADQRAVQVSVHDHGWLRILDVPAALAARTYRAPLDAVVAVDDPLGFATGTWRLTVDGGQASTVETDGPADVSLDVATLSALYVGGVSAVRLRAAGRLNASAEIAAAIDDAFRAADAPLLGIWY